MRARGILAVSLMLSRSPDKATTLGNTCLSGGIYKPDGQFAS